MISIQQIIRSFDVAYWGVLSDDILNAGLTFLRTEALVSNPRESCQKVIEMNQTQIPSYKQ